MKIIKLNNLKTIRIILILFLPIKLIVKLNTVFVWRASLMYDLYNIYEHMAIHMISIMYKMFLMFNDFYLF